jgi:hypothetical protein
MVTRGIMTITGSPSSPFSVRVTSSLRQLTTLRMSEKPITDHFSGGGSVLSVTELSLDSKYRGTCGTRTGRCSIFSSRLSHCRV